MRIRPLCHLSGCPSGRAVTAFPSGEGDKERVKARPRSTANPVQGTCQLHCSWGGFAPQNPMSEFLATKRHKNPRLRLELPCTYRCAGESIRKSQKSLCLFVAKPILDGF